MKLGWNLSDSLLRSERINRANKSVGTSIGLSSCGRLHLPPVLPFAQSLRSRSKPQMKRNVDRYDSIQLSNGISSRIIWQLLRPNYNKGTDRTRFRILKANLGIAASILARRMAFPLILFSAGLALVQPCAGAPFEFEETGSLATARLNHTATLLPNGKVLVAGGLGGTLASAELYDPANGTWAATGSLATGRYWHTATLLPNGKVLVVGGRDSSLNTLASAELYDPTSGTWTVTGSLATARYSHTTTLLPSGKVLVVGGEGCCDTLATAELYDPTSGTWTPTGSLADIRAFHTATLLPNGKVLVVGGSPYIIGLASAELYDPASGTWTTTGSLRTGRYSHSATLLPNGKVLVVGGQDGNFNTFASAELYDPASGTWTATGRLRTGRIFTQRHCCPTARCSSQAVLTTASLSRARNSTIRRAGLDGYRQPRQRTHFRDTATLLPNGKVLVAGGSPDERWQTLSQARNSTIRRAGPGQPPVVSCQHTL